MSRMTAAKVTPEEFLAMPDQGLFELADGHLNEVNTGVLSSRVGLLIACKMDVYGEANNLGWVWGPDLLVRCYPDPTGFRKPDACFVSRDRLAAGCLEDAALTIAADLVVEVISPNDLSCDVDRKIVEYLEAGVR